MEDEKMSGRRIVERTMPNGKREWYINALEKEKTRLSDILDKMNKDVGRKVAWLDGRHGKVRAVSRLDVSVSWRHVQLDLEDAIKKIKVAINGIPPSPRTTE